VNESYSLENNYRETSDVAPFSTRWSLIRAFYSYQTSPTSSESVKEKVAYHVAKLKKLRQNSA